MEKEKRLSKKQKRQIGHQTMEKFKCFYQGENRKAFKLFAYLVEQYGEFEVRHGIDICILRNTHKVNYLIELLKRNNDMF